MPKPKKKPQNRTHTFDFAMNQDDIALELGITRQRVDQLLKRAIRKARAILEKHGYRPEDIFP